MATPNQQDSNPSGTAKPSGTTDKLREEAKDYGSQAKRAAEQASHKAKAEFDEFRKEFAAESSRLTSAATDEAYRFADGRKTAAAEAMHDLAGSVRESSRAFEDRPNLQALFESAAEGLDGFAATIHDRSLAQLYGDAEEIARRRPAAVAIGAGIVGLLVARVARSSGMRARLEEERSAAERRWAEREAANNKSRNDKSQGA